MASLWLQQTSFELGSLVDAENMLVFRGSLTDPHKFEYHSLLTGQTGQSRCLAQFAQIKIMKLSAGHTHLVYYVKTALALAIFRWGTTLVHPLICKLTTTHITQLFWVADHSIIVIHPGGIQLYGITKLIDSISDCVQQVHYLPTHFLLCFLSSTARIHVIQVTETSFLPIIRLQDPASAIRLVSLYSSPFLVILLPSNTLLLHPVSSNPGSPTILSCPPLTSLSNMGTVDNLLFVHLSKHIHIFDIRHSCCAFPPLPLDLPALSTFLPQSNILLTPHHYSRLVLPTDLSQCIPSPLSRCSFLLRRADSTPVVLEYFSQLLVTLHFQELSPIFSLLHSHLHSDDQLFDVLSKHPHPHLLVLHLRFSPRDKPTTTLVEALIRGGRYFAVSQYIPLLPQSVGLAALLLKCPPLFVDGLEMLTRFASIDPRGVFTELEGICFDFELLREVVEVRDRSIPELCSLSFRISHKLRQFLDFVDSSITKD